MFQKFERALIPGAINIIENPPGRGDGKRPAGAGQFGIRGQRRDRMAGHFDFRDHRDETLPRIIHHVPNFGLGIIAAVTLAGGRAPRADFRQARIAFDFDPPPLVFG